MKGKLYTLPDFERRTLKIDQAWWNNDATIIFLITSFAGLDAVTLYTVFDTVMYESQIIAIAITVGVALALNFIPLLSARLLHEWRYDRGGVRIWMLIGLVSTFTIIFSATFYLRWVTRALCFAFDSGLVSTIGDPSASSLAGTNSSSKEAVGITVLLAIIPFITSAISFTLGYINDDPVKRSIQKLTVNISQIKEHMAVMNAALIELSRDWESYYKQLDQQQLACAMRINASTTKYMQAEARFMLAKKLKTANDISEILAPEEEEEEVYENEKDERHNLVSVVHGSDYNLRRV